MKELGYFIDPEGTVKTFGKFIPYDSEEKWNSPGHEESFVTEIVDTFYFSILGYEYNKQKSFYTNAIDLSISGCALILNDSYSDEDTSILGYLPTNPTNEQYEQLDSINKQIKDKFKKMRLYDFEESGIEENEYSSLEQCLEMKKDNLNKRHK